MKAIVVGGGIGGLATALSLHAEGIEVEVYEQSRTIRELGVGINTLPHAIKELAALGLLEALDRVAVRTYELIRSEEHTSELQSLMRISYAVFCLKKKNHYTTHYKIHHT